MVKNAKKLANTVYSVPEKIDAEISRLKLKAMGLNIDTLTPEQKKYLKSWEMGRKDRLGAASNEGAGYGPPFLKGGGDGREIIALVKGDGSGPEMIA